jgi:hypothetical protein
MDVEGGRVNGAALEKVAPSHFTKTPTPGLTTFFEEGSFKPRLNAVTRQSGDDAMKKILALLLLGAVAAAQAPSPALAYYQSGSETFPGNGGTHNGQVIETITINYDTNIISYRYVNGSTFTFSQTHAFCVGMGNYLRQRNLDGE